MTKAAAIRHPAGRLESSIHSPLVWAPPPRQVPRQREGIPMERGILQSVEAACQGPPLEGKF